jgi:site-specific DNA recombinase
MNGHPHGSRATIYARVSSDQQTEAGTIASQLEALQQRVRQDGLTLDQELCFLDEGHSGGTLLRPALERLRDAAAEGAVDRLYVHSPDRLARNYAYQVLLVDEFRRGGVELVFLNRALGQSAEDDLLLQVQGMVAEYERAKILERSRRGKIHAARRGCVAVLAGVAPYGFRYVCKAEGGGQARYEVVWDQARAVRQMFEWVGRDRLTLAEVCRRLQQQGLRSPTGNPHWDRTTVWGILKNPAYKGTACYGKTRHGQRRPRLRPQRGQPEQPRRPFSVYDCEEAAIPIAVPALVGEELFAAVAEQLEENRRRSRQQARGARYLLQGLLVCKRCDHAYHGKPVSRTSGGQKHCYAYYRCGGTESWRFGGHKVCANKQVRVERLDEAVWQDVCGLLNDPQRVEEEYQRRLGGEQRGGDPAGAASLTKLIRNVKRGIARLIDAYAEGLVDKSEFEPRIRNAKERLAKLEGEAHAQADQEAQVQELRLVIGRLQEFADRVRCNLGQADWQARRDIIRALVKRVEVDTEEVRVVYRISAPRLAPGTGEGVLQDCGGHQ